MTDVTCSYFRYQNNRKWILRPNFLRSQRRSSVETLDRREATGSDVNVKKNSAIYIRSASGKSRSREQKSAILCGDAKQMLALYPGPRGCQKVDGIIGSLPLPLSTTTTTTTKTFAWSCLPAKIVTEKKKKEELLSISPLILLAHKQRRIF